MNIGALASNDPQTIQRWVMDLLSAPVFVPGFSVSRLPDPARYAKNIHEGCSHCIYVYDETGGPVLAFSDGSNWLRVTDRSVVS